jgi:hypothetical protein
MFHCAWRSDQLPEKRPPQDRNPTPLYQTHPELHHYTDERGLRGIVESNSLWGTYFEHLNDTSEIHRLRETFIKSLADRLETLFADLRTKRCHHAAVWKTGGPVYVARIWANALYRVIFSTDKDKRGTETYVTSFCSHAGDLVYERRNGLLSQWRGYGRDGFCLVFDTEKLLTLLQEEAALNMYAYSGCDQVHYPREEIPSSELFRELLRSSEDILGRALMDNREFSVDEALVPFVVSAVTFKHEGFFEEREIRLTLVAGTDLGDQQMEGVEGYKRVPVKARFIQKRGSIEREHITLFGQDFGPLPIKRVIVGPSRGQSQSAVTAAEIVGDGILVEKSETPYVE